MSTDEDEVVELIACPECGHLVPPMNLELHQLRACASRRPSAATRAPESTSNAPISSPTTSSRTLSPARDVFTGSGSHSAASAPLQDPQTLTPDGTSAQSAIDLSSPSFAEQEWACSKCTLLNPMDVFHCQACGNSAPHRPPDATRRERLLEIPPLSGAATRRSTYPATSQNPNNGNNNSPYYLSGGAIVGGVLGGVGAYLRGRPVGTAALNGALTGALGGAVLRDATAPRRNPPRSVRVVRHQPGNGHFVTYLTTTTNGTVLRQVTRPQRGGDPMLDYLLQAMNGFPRDNIDGMSYEELLQAFGDGTDNLAAQEQDIQALPVSAVHDPDKQLPKECRDCAICLDPFESGQNRKVLPCLHGFHQDCIDQWLRSNGSCPICKHRIGRNGN